jgi:hypothetical protein
MALMVAGSPADAAGPAASFDQPSVTATGTHEVILSIPQFGRYAITVSSPQGAALQLVDRMGGPGDVEGTAGAQDGRIDAFLERGTYKVRIIADAHGTGTARLAVTAFTELQPAPVQLVEDKPVLGRLGDDQQISWWVVIPTRGTYEFEAGGRYVTDLRLWQPGGWLLGAAPRSDESDADPAQPLALRQLTAQLEPGVYQLTAYGGPGLAWSKASTAAPFSLRWGIPSLSDSGRFVETASPLGLDRYLVPSTATDVRLVLDKPEPAQIFAQNFDDNMVFDQAQANAAGIDKTSRDPVADLSLSSNGSAPFLVTVLRRPGEKYRLEIFNASGGATPLNATGNALVAATLPGNPDDEIDAGFLVVDNAGQKIIASSVINLDTALPWRRHFNLLGQAQTYLFTDQNINLEVDGAGVPAQFVVDRFMTNVPDGHVVPLAQASGGVWTLTPGYYVLTALPQGNGQGILTMSLEAAGVKPALTDSPRLPAALFQDLLLAPQTGDTLYTSLGTQNFGFRQEALPAALVEPLSFELAAGARAAFPITTGEASQLDVTDQSGGARPFTLDGQTQTGPVTIQAGAHQFGVQNSAPGDATITIAQTPVRLLPATTLPAIPADQISAPSLADLPPGTPAFVDLARGQAQNFAVPVGVDSLYQFQTTGLLETSGAIRTRTNPGLAQAEGNGVGRNFLLQPYLRQGDYQLTIQAQGQTTGHAGVSVSATPVVDAGALALGRAARLTLAPGTAASYQFHISAPGSFHLYTLGLGHQFTMRLEDKDGWPLITPGGEADVTMDFAPGDYRMILLPGPVENRAVTELDQILLPPTYQGHGPFAAQFDQDMQNRWMEPEAGQARKPDQWDFSLPAPATVTISINNGMRAELHKAGGGSILAVTGHEWTGKLSAGDYSIDASAAVPNNRIDYDFSLTTQQLLPGQSRTIQAPARIPISLGGSPQYEIFSSGNQDVRASLYDAAGKLVEQNDDRDNDWNFLIAGAFPPGMYTLAVDPVGSDSAQTTVAIAAPAAVQDAPLSAGESRQLTDGLVHVLPLPAAPSGALLLAGATAAVPVDLALEGEQNGVWEALAQTSGLNPYLAIPVADGTKYRLRAWPEDHGASPVTITTVTQAGGAIDLFHGVDLQFLRLGNRTIGWAEVSLPEAEILAATDSTGALRWSSFLGAPLTHDPLTSFATASTTLWLTDSAPHHVAIHPVDLLSQPSRLALGAPLDLAVPSSDSLALWQVQGQQGQAGIAIDNGTGLRAMAISTGAELFTQAVALQVPGLANPILHLWQAGAPVASLPITLSRTSFAPPMPFNAAIGTNDGSVPAGGALSAPLPAGWNRLSLSLPAGIVAVLSRGGATETLIMANGSAPDIVETDADSLVLLNPGHADAAFSVSLQPVGTDDLTLAPGGLITSYNATPAVLHIAIQEGAEARLRIAGAATGITAIDSAGRVTAGADAQSDAGGTAIVTVQPGLAVISEDGTGATNQIAKLISGTGSENLSGQNPVLGVAPPEAAQLVHFETDAPIVLRAGNVPEAFPAGASVNLFQPKDQSLNLSIHAVSGPLSGMARFDTIPAIPITDGLGPHVLIGPGQARLFRFSLDAARSIGVGVRGSVDDASVRLLASDGTVLGTGLVVMRDLAPGTYYLVAEVPADGTAAVVQPALVGKTLPDDGPPDDVKAQYYALAGEN